jgi:hypothetical protein
MTGAVHGFVCRGVQDRASDNDAPLSNYRTMTALNSLPRTSMDTGDEARKLGVLGIILVVSLFGALQFQDLYLFTAYLWGSCVISRSLKTYTVPADTRAGVFHWETFRDWCYSCHGVHPPIGRRVFVAAERRGDQEIWPSGQVDWLHNVCLCHNFSAYLTIYQTWVVTGNLSRGM